MWGIQRARSRRPSAVLLCAVTQGLQTGCGEEELARMSSSQRHLCRCHSSPSSIFTMLSRLAVAAWLLIALVEPCRAGCPYQKLSQVRRRLRLTLQNPRRHVIASTRYR